MYSGVGIIETTKPNTIFRGAVMNQYNNTIQVKHLKPSPTGEQKYYSNG